MRKSILFALLACASMAGCSTSQLCTADAIIQPLTVVTGEAVATATGSGPAAAAAVALDAPVHTQIQMDCSKLTAPVANP